MEDLVSLAYSSSPSFLPGSWVPAGQICVASTVLSGQVKTGHMWSLQNRPCGPGLRSCTPSFASRASLIVQDNSANSGFLLAYSDEGNQCSGLIVISVPGWCDQSSERSDAGSCIL
jgi:hypothetical protein